MLVRVGTSLDTKGGTGFRGFVDVINRRDGVRGWAVDTGDPGTPVRLALCVGEVVAAETVAEIPREDVARKLGTPTIAGFRFPATLIQSIAAFADHPDDEISVRIAGTTQVLGTAGRKLRAADVARELDSPGASEAGGSSADLDRRLEGLRGEAAPLLEQMLRPLAEGLQGYIEAVAYDPSGVVWFIGWMKTGHALEFGGVISDGRKFAAALATAPYRRDDLPADANGVVGMIASDWRPGGPQSDLHIFFGPAGRFHLRGHSSLRVLSISDMAAEYEVLRHRGLDDARAVPVKRRLAALENWQPTRSASQWYGTEMAVDRILYIPTLGCFVEGWVLSPMRQIEALRLRIGGTTMISHADALYRKKRLDLAAVFPGAEAMALRAGFVGLFTGETEPGEFGDPVLKIVFEGGGSANWSVPPNVFRRLGQSAAIEDALRFFPALPEEPFFPRFAQAAIRAQRALMTSPVPILIKTCRRPMVFVLPRDRCDLFLLFEELAEQTRDPQGLDGFAFIASANANRSDALWMVREFQAHHDLPCSLLMIEDASHALPLLPEILGAIGAVRFFFAAAGVFLTGDGWAQARLALAPDATGLTLFGLAPDPFDQRDDRESITARCFAWSTGPFARWSLDAPAFLGGFHRDNFLLRATAACVVRQASARSAWPLLVSRTEDAINGVIHARHEAVQTSAPAPHKKPPAMMLAAGGRG